MCHILTFTLLSISMRFSFSLFILFLLSTFLFAQKAQISGSVVDSSSLQSLEFASVSLLRLEDRVPLAGKLTDQKGRFQLEKLTIGKYLLRVSNVGFYDKTITIDLKEESSILQIGNLLLQPSTELLEALVVKGQNPAFLVGAERKVFNASKFKDVQGQSAIEMIRKLPSVAINAENEITLRGSKGFLLLVNGSPTNLEPKETLQLINATDIKSIEVITSPSAKYDADGKAGIINIITHAGLEGRAYAIAVQAGPPPLNDFGNKVNILRHGIDASMQGSHSKIEYSLGLSFQKNDNAGYRVGDVWTELGSKRTAFPSEGERSFRRQTYSLRGLLVYKPTKSQNLSVGFYHGGKSQYRLADLNYANRTTQLATNELISTLNYFNSNLVLRKGSFSLADVRYKVDLSKKATLSTSILYENAVLSGFTDNRNLQQERTLSYTYNTNRAPLNALRVKVDYSKEIASWNLSTGYQYRYQKQLGSYLYQEQDVGSDILERVEAFSAEIELLNRIHGIYMDASYQKEKDKVLLGLRYENAYRDFKVLSGSGGDFPLLLNNLFPNLQWSRELPRDWTFHIGLNRRVQRSTNNELNPYPEREHSETLEQGDPNILPEFIWQTETGLVKNVKNGSIFLNLYRQDIENIINRVNAVFNDTILNRIYTNAGNAILLGTETGFNLKFGQHLESYLGFNLYNLQINGALFGGSVPVHNSGWVYSINTQHNFTFGNHWGAQVGFNFLSRRVTAQGEDSRFLLPNAVLSKGIKNGTLSLLWQNISIFGLPSNQQEITTSGSNFFTTTNYLQETNIFRISYTWKINKSEKIKELPKSEFGEREF